MAVLVVVGAMVMYLFAFWLGRRVGRTWGSLPNATPGEVVKFRGYTAGVEHHMVIEEIHHDRDKTTVVLVSSHKAKV